MKLQKFAGQLTCTVIPSASMEEVVALLLTLGWEIAE